MLYKLFQIQGEKSERIGYWYARAAHLDTMVDLDALAEHMANHNTPYSKGAIKGVLTDMVSCIRELVLEGKSVKIPDLAIFSCALKSEGAPTLNEFDANTHIKGVRLTARATGTFRASEIQSKVTLKRVD